MYSGSVTTALFRNIACAARVFSVTVTVTGVTLCLGNRDGHCPRCASDTFEARYTWLGCTGQTRQNGGPAVAPRRVRQDGGDGFSGVADDHATVVSLDAITPKRGFCQLFGYS
jgi:hypothetical protein